MKYLLVLVPFLAAVLTEHCMHKNDCQKHNVTHCVQTAELGCSNHLCTCYDKNDIGLKCAMVSDCASVSRTELPCNITLRHCMDNECHCENPHGFHPGGFPGGPGGMHPGGMNGGTHQQHGGAGSQQ